MTSPDRHITSARSSSGVLSHDSFNQNSNTNGNTSYTQRSSPSHQFVDTQSSSEVGGPEVGDESEEQEVISPLPDLSRLRLQSERNHTPQPQSHAPQPKVTYIGRSVTTTPVYSNYCDVKTTPFFTGQRPVQEVDPTFAGRRDVRNLGSMTEKQIVSAKGTVRGFKNRVRAGIATFWAQPSNQVS